MNRMRRSATINDNIVQVISPVTEEELKMRNKLYDILTPLRFANASSTFGRNQSVKAKQKTRLRG